MGDRWEETEEKKNCLLDGRLRKGIAEAVHERGDIVPVDGLLLAVGADDTAEEV